MKACASVPILNEDTGIRNTVTAAERIIIMMILTTLLSFLFLLHVLSQNLYFRIDSLQKDKNSREITTNVVDR